MAKQSSSKKVYIVIAVIALIVVAGIGYKVVKHQQNLAMSTATSAPVAIKVSSVPQTTTSTGLSNKTDTSNQQLDQDVQSVQSSMNQLQEDQNTATQDTTNQALDVPQQ